IGRTLGLSWSFTVTKTAPASGKLPSAAIWALANAMPKLSASPIASPVDRISGPNTVSTPGSLVKGKTASLTATPATGSSSGMPKSSSVPPGPPPGPPGSPGPPGRAGDDHRGKLGERHPGGLAHKRYGPRGPRIDLQHVHDPVLDGVLNVHEPHHPERLRERLRMAAHFLQLLVADQVGRQHTGRVARVHPGILDMLHHDADDAPLQAGERVDVGSERVLEEVVDQHRMLRRDARCFNEAFAQRAVVVDDFHGPAAEHVR